ncbi:unnamed protein product [Arabidopsis lyrata]|nr:unnamed protein product [Arabidopsis lyrata]
MKNLVIFVFLFLSITTVINGGITSEFVRQALPSIEMSLDTFPSPDGYNTPEQFEAPIEDFSMAFLTGEASPAAAFL